MKEVSVIIPIYKAELSAYELHALTQISTVLHRYPLIVIHPEGLDLTSVLRQYPMLQTESFPSVFFQGIKGYNKLMLSAELYERFSESEYILIAQLDTYIFRDELSQWCQKGYDYIGAPWLEKPVYRLPLVKQMMHLSHLRKAFRGKPDKQNLYNKVGNGGLSLRKVSTHLRAIHTHCKRIDHYLAQEHSHFYYEDVFWATEIDTFRYPSAMEALHFAFDKYPAYCYKLTEGVLPFGCHAWSYRKMKRFWFPIIFPKK